MFEFRRQVYKAVLNDLGFSGCARDPVTLGLFDSYAVAEQVATRAAGDVSRTGVMGEVLSDSLVVQVFETVGEYDHVQQEALRVAAQGKLSKAELDALRN